MGCTASSLVPQDCDHNQQHHPNQQPINHQHHQQQHHHQQQRHQQQHQPRPTDKEIDHIEKKEVPITKDLLYQYMNLEKEIYQLEKKNSRKSLNLKKKELSELNESTAQLKDLVQKLVIQTAKEKKDVEEMQDQSVKRFFADQSQYEEKLSKEQEEYLNALNSLEVSKKELKGVEKQQDFAEIEVNRLQEEVDELQALYKKQDEILASVFNGTYGSNREDMLETELDQLMEKKQRISVAKYKWANGRMLLQYAVNQLGFSCRRWQELAQVPPQVQNMQLKLTMATEVRNNLIAANRNITSTINYLSGVQFPYCTGAEMQTLNSAINNIYTDMQTTERHAHAYQCYSVTYKRATALLQWFDNVINETISKDLEKATLDTKAKAKELREERISMFKAKIREVEGDNVSFQDLDLGKDIDMEEEEVSPELVVSAIEPDQASLAGDLANTEAAPATEGSVQTENNDSALLPLNELAPPPNNDDIFGNINALKEQHEKEKNEYAKTQEVNKTRMEQGLQEKLQSRRSRRRRQEINEDS